MRIAIALAATMLAVTGPVPALAQDSTQPAAVSQASLDLAQEILATAYPQEVREPMFLAVADQMEQQVMTSVMQQLGDIPTGARKVINDWQTSVSGEQRDILRRHIPALMEAWAVSYASVFSEAELRDILAFVQTDTGSTFMLKSNDIISDPAFASANQAYLDETMALMQTRMPDLIAALVEVAEDQ
ncbi:DUF2059 domain-containing protein [Aurantiacibacter poecillastricola]|uniref:DUF2059 domain-containing protein n=1 Tax=Aurantiacibacter poecillastricola TaxID=3064385 RepID=UPI00273DCA40|nr:DUF2059 domain-containing protein [Aurantiacibacter sp. 219JJ12-13]MDP5261942.1 DUF2059 domain-containing protein [Aurantiacibacter sp. 219JJ12-13]